MTMENSTPPTSDNDLYRCKLNEDFKYILLPVTYTLVFIVGLGLNITAMYFIIFRTKHWKPSTIYMINLNVCDTLYILTLPFLIYYYADGNDWPIGDAMCRLIRFLFNTNLYASILFLSCISLHRFLGVCHPVRSLSWMSGRRARLVSAGVWMIVLVLQAPVLHFSRTRLNVKDWVCHDTTIPALFENFIVYSSVVTVLVFILPFGVVLFTNVMMVKQLRQSNVLGGSVSQLSKKKSVKMIVIVLLAFMLCFLPFHVSRTIYYTIRYIDKSSCEVLRLSNNMYKFTRTFVSLNSCIDPILYFMAGQSFRNSFNKKSSSRSEKSTSNSTTTSMRKMSINCKHEL